jgi:hypothetical protein
MSLKSQTAVGTLCRAINSSGHEPAFEKIDLSMEGARHGFKGPTSCLRKGGWMGIEITPDESTHYAN